MIMELNKRTRDALRKHGFIALAPLEAELLGALEDLVSACVDHHIDTEQARAAIRKAKGES